METVFFDNIDKLGRIVLTTVMVYVLIVLVTKASGKRSTSQLNNFDIGTLSLTVFDNQIRLYLTAI